MAKLRDRLQRIQAMRTGAGASPPGQTARLSAQAAQSGGNAAAALGQMAQPPVLPFHSVGGVAAMPGQTALPSALPFHSANGAARPVDVQAAFAGWVPAGFQTLKRELFAEAPPALPAVLPAALPIVIPDMGRCGNLPAIEDLLFFDLETTGLSIGAGTVAFLAAFGCVAGKTPSGRQLRITQYLLLDYPGENDFLEALLGEFAKNPLVIVSFNGKTFDSQILKNRCLMNGIRPPEFLHADLLHPARRLWKRLLPNCSQGTIEEQILGIDRGGDTPGALAPDIWFGFLKTGDAGPLLDICEHNRRDIAGLAAIFAALCHIAADPCRAPPPRRFDIELLALRWRDAMRGKYPAAGADARSGELWAAGQGLLRFAAGQGYPRAALVYALDMLREGHYAEGRERLSTIAGGEYPAEIRASALRSLAIDSEWRLGNAGEALELAERGLALLPAEAARREECERRVERLRKKNCFL